MYRTHTCGELDLTAAGQNVIMSGWVQRIRNKGFVIWIDLRDRYGITQLVLDEARNSPELLSAAAKLGRETVIQIRGEVLERESKNANMPTGEIEVLVQELTLLNKALLPPFTIEDETDGGEELRMKYRYLDIRRNPVKQNLIFRHKVALEVRNYLSTKGFIEVETPFLIKSTPEGARDFVVPSRMNTGEFYALPQSPQTFKQLLMVGGMDRYFQIVRCFRDEDLRADRQPEFTQIDCEMAFVQQEDILQTFEGLATHLLRTIKGWQGSKFPRMSYAEAMERYGIDKPDIRFGMELKEISSLVKGKGFQVFDTQNYIAGFSVSQGALLTRKQLDEIIDWVKRPQIGAQGLIWVRYQDEGTIKSSVDKFYAEADLIAWCDAMKAKPGDLLLILSGDKEVTQKRLGLLRLKMAEQLGLRNPDTFAPLWITDFPLLEWDEETGRYHAMHHPFTSPKPEDLALLDAKPGEVRANAYDLVLNGNEIGGGSIRIHDKNLQAKMFGLLGFTPEKAQEQFGFLMDAFQYGAPPHGGIAFGFDRLVAILGGQETIRDFIAFPKNNSGRDVMIEAPAPLGDEQLKELHLSIKS